MSVFSLGKTTNMYTSGHCSEIISKQRKCIEISGYFLKLCQTKNIDTSGPLSKIMSKQKTYIDTSGNLFNYGLGVGDFDVPGTAHITESEKTIAKTNSTT